MLPPSHTHTLLADPFVQDVVIGNKEIRFGGKLRDGFAEVRGQECLRRGRAPFHQTRASCWQWRQLCVGKLVLVGDECLPPDGWLCPPSWLNPKAELLWESSSASVTCHPLWFAIRFSGSHPALRSSWRSIRSEIREGDYSAWSFQCQKWKSQGCCHRRSSLPLSLSQRTSGNAVLNAFRPDGLWLVPGSAFSGESQPKVCMELCSIDDHSGNTHPLEVKVPLASLRSNMHQLNC